MVSNSPRAQHGFGLVMAVFIITILAALGVYIVALSTTQHQTAALTVQQTRALNAARSGIQWGAYKALHNDACPASPASFSPAAMAAFTITVTCAASTHQISGQTVTVYQLDATATSGSYGSADYVRRHIEATVSDDA